MFYIDHYKWKVFHVVLLINESIKIHSWTLVGAMLLYTLINIYSQVSDQRPESPLVSSGGRF